MLIIGCGQTSTPTPTDNASTRAPVVGGVPKINSGQVPAPGGQGQPVVLADSSDQDKYTAALQEGFDLLGQRKYPEALTALEAARKFKDNEFIQAEIKKLRLRIDQNKAPEQAVQDIQTVLDQGKIAEAGKLAGDALKEFGASDAAPQLMKLKLQADAMVAAAATDKAAQSKAFREQGQAALDVGNLRAAALAFDQALALSDDPVLRKTNDDLHAKLALYDDNRQKAQELRKDPANLEDAINLLKEAQKAWQTLQVSQDIDEYTTALQNRRDTLSVADFDVRGEVGIPAAERVFAEELLPRFKSKFDLVERAQLAKVIDELKLQAGRLGDNDADQREVGRLAKVRYLVLGSVTRVGGITVNARLVDVSTGLIVQAAKINAGSPEEVLAQLPKLAELLMMTDAQRLAYEADLAKQAQPIEPVKVEQALPPPPDVLNAGQPLPPPVLVDTNRPPAFVGINVGLFQRFPPLPSGPMPPLVYGGDVEEMWKRRALLVSVEVGDNLFRRRRYAAAQRYFEFSLLLAPGQTDVSLRVTRVRPLLPPPVVVVVVPPPRVAIIDFPVFGDPAFVPPGLGAYAPINLAPYFYSNFEVVDRGEVYWWMARMGMTVRDLMEDPYARRWLGRALNIRYFVLGNIVQTASFDVNTYLIDAEYGYLNGRGFVHCVTPFELKCRLGELAQMTLTPPGEFERQREQYRRYEELVVKARLAGGKGDFTIAFGLLTDAQKLRPGSIELQVYRQDYERQARRRAWEDERRHEYQREQALALAQRQRQDELCREAERQRKLAAALDQQQRDLLAQKQLIASNSLVLQARLAMKGGNVRGSIQTYESALALHQDDGVFRELAAARLELDRVTKARQIEEAKLQQAQMALQQQQELQAARAKLDAERKKRQQDDAAARKAREDRDNAEYTRLLADGQKQLGGAKYNDAISSFQAALRLKKTDQAEGLLHQATLAVAKDDAGRKDLEGKLAADKEARLKADAAAKLNQDKYQAALLAAQKALADRDYKGALVKFTEAGNFLQTDAVLTGLKQAQAGLDKVHADELAAKKKQDDEQTRQANFQKLMTEGKNALTAKDYTTAVDRFQAAGKLIPGNVDASAMLAKAQQALNQTKKAADDAAAAAAKKKTDFDQALKQGQTFLAAKNYDQAIAQFKIATTLFPSDATAAGLLKQAETARGEAANAARVLQLVQAAEKSIQMNQFDAADKAIKEATQLAPKDAGVARVTQMLAQARNAAADADKTKKKTAFDQAIKQGQTLQAGKKYDEAIKAYQQAATLMPGDPTAAALLKQAQKERDNWLAEQRQAEYTRQMQLGAAADKQKKWDEAMKAYEAALKQMPKDAKASEALNKATYNQHMSEGDKAFTARRFMDAVREYDAALKLYPKDQEAAKALKKAQNAK
jgi:tetratricopeptide (TPR) repeat protein